MLVVCKTNISQCDPLVLPHNPQYAMSESNYVVASGWYSVDGNFSGYCLTVGAEYQIYGILLYGDQKRYLVVDDDSMPGFLPTELFQICNSTLFFDWKICEYTIETQALLFIGYPELCESYSNLIGLIDWQPQHIERFLSYKEYLLSNIEQF